MSQSLEERVAQLEKLLLIANEDIQRLKDRREDLDMVSEKAQQMEDLLFREIDKNRCLANKVSDIDEEHARMFLISERIRERAEVFSLQYSSMEEGMGYMVKSMRRHDEETRKLTQNIAKVDWRMDKVELQTARISEIEKRMIDALDTRLREALETFQNFPKNFQL